MKPIKKKLPMRLLAYPFLTSIANATMTVALRDTIGGISSTGINRSFMATTI